MYAFVFTCFSVSHACRPLDPNGAFVVLCTFRLCLCLVTRCIPSLRPIAHNFLIRLPFISFVCVSPNIVHNLTHTHEHAPTHHSATVEAGNVFQIRTTKSVGPAAKSAAIRTGKQPSEYTRSECNVAAHKLRAVRRERSSTMRLCEVFRLCARSSVAHISGNIGCATRNVCSN